MPTILIVMRSDHIIDKICVIIQSINWYRKEDTRYSGHGNCNCITCSYNILTEYLRLHNVHGNTTLRPNLYCKVVSVWVCARAIEEAMASASKILYLGMGKNNHSIVIVKSHRNCVAQPFTATLWLRSRVAGRRVAVAPILLHRIFNTRRLCVAVRKTPL